MEMPRSLGFVSGRQPTWRISVKSRKSRLRN